MSNISTRGRRGENYCIYFTSDGRPIKRYAPTRRRTPLSPRHIAWLEAYLAETDDPVRHEVIKGKLAGRQKVEKPRPVEVDADAVLIDRIERGIIRRYGRTFDELRAAGYSKKNRPPEPPPKLRRGNKGSWTEHNGGDFIDKRAWRDLKSQVATPPRGMGKCREEAEILVDGNWLTLKKRYVKNPGARIEIGPGRWITTAGLVFRECLSPDGPLRGSTPIGRLRSSPRTRKTSLPLRPGPVTRKLPPR